LQVQESSVRVGRVLHDLLNLFFTEHSILYPIVGFNDDNTDRTNTQKVSNLQGVRCRRVLAITKKTTSSRMARERLGSRNYPKALCVGGHQQLTSSGIGEFVSLELSPDVTSVLRTKVNGVGISTTVGTLNDNSLKKEKDTISRLVRTIVHQNCCR
jgi:hypothetical protein